MARCRVDSSVERKIVQGFEFPLGVYPVEEMTPREGYTLAFESADGGDMEGEAPFGEAGDEPPSFGGEPDSDIGDGPEGGSGGPGGGGGGGGGWEQWPDRYVFDVNIRSSRVESLCRQLFALLPGRVFPILDVMGNDGFREIDPYIAYDLVGIERYLDAVRRFRTWFYEDGLVGFGAMSEDPFIYVFIDEHKIVTVRVQADMKEQVEKVLRAFDLQEVDKIAGADAAVHEHRGILDSPTNRPDLLTHDEIVEELRDFWGLTLNIDPMSNTDDGGQDLGIVPWRCVVRVFDVGGEVRYAEAFVTADCFQTAGDLSVSAVQELDPERPPPLPPPAEEGDDQEADYDVLSADRIRPEEISQVPAITAHGKPDLTKNAVIEARWLE